MKHRGLTFFLAALLPFPFLRFAIAEPIASTTWDFDEPAAYVYDESRITISDSQARLRPAEGWFDGNWNYRRTITIDSSENDRLLSNYQIELALTEDNFDFDLARSDGGDLRFVSFESGPLDYWLEQYNADSRWALVTFELPDVYPNGVQTVDLYYGNPQAQSLSNWAATFQTGPAAPQEQPIYLSGAHNAFPSLARLSNGSLMVVYRTASAHISSDGMIRGILSYDQGQTWTERLIFNEPGIDDRTNLGFTRLSDNTLLIPFYQYDGEAPTGAYLLRSTDNGQTWSLKQPVGNFFTDWTALYGQIIERPDGTLLLPAYGKNADEDFYQSALLSSADGAVTWSLRSIIAGGERSFNETSVLEIDDATLLAVLRSENTGPGLFRSFSYDAGATWTEPEYLYDGSSPELFRLNDETIVLYSSDRQAPSLGIRAAYSVDGGQTWSGGMLVGTGTADLGYPATTVLSYPPHRNSLMTIYYSNSELKSTIYSLDYIFDNPNHQNWFDGLESGSLSQWESQRGSTIRATNLQQRTGSYSMQINDTAASEPTYIIRSLANIPQVVGSVSFWLKPQALLSGAEFGLLDDSLPASDPSTDRRFWFRIAPDGLLLFDDQSNGWSGFSELASLTMNAWSKITLNYNSSENQTQVLINGQPIGNASASHDGGAIYKLMFKSSSIAGTGDNFFIDDLSTRQSAHPRPVVNIAERQMPYPSDAPSIEPIAASADSVASVESFREQAVKNGGEITYQLSPDNGATWFWWAGTSWQSTVGGAGESTTAARINAHVTSFPASGGQLLFRAFLQSNGSQLIKLDAVIIRYLNS